MTIDRIDTGYVITFKPKKVARHRADTSWYWLIAQFVFMIAYLLYGNTWKSHSMIMPVINTCCWISSVIGMTGLAIWRL